MKNYLLPLFGLFFLALGTNHPALAQNEPNHNNQTSPNSKITAVTLYSDRAQVSRRAESTFAAGAHTVVLRGIPHGVDTDSISAAGSGARGTVIQGVELKNVPLRTDVSKEVQELHNKLEGLNRDRESLTRRKEMLERQLALVKGINLDASISDASDKPARPRTPKEMVEILNLISETETRIDPELRTSAEALLKNAREIELIKAQLAKLQPERRSESVIEINLVTAQPGKVVLDVSYQVRGAKWHPSYNLHVDDSSGEVVLENFAVISQSTGEDWNNVELTLSTARPQVSLVRPDPAPYLLDIIRAQPLSDRRMERSMAPQSLAARKASVGPESALMSMSDSQTVLEEVEIAQQGATVSYGAIVQYKLPNTVTLASDGSTQKVFLEKSELGAKIYNIAVPAYTEEVFREAELTNLSQATLLPGAVSIFSNDRFVGKRTLELIQPNQKFKLPLGLSEQLQVSRKLLKRFEDDSGLIRQVRRIRDDFEIELTNNSQEEVEIVILEGVPLSRNEIISVNIVDEKPASLASDDKRRIVTTPGIHEWHQKVSAGKNAKILYSSVVEFPAKERVTGMPN